MFKRFLAFALSFAMVISMANGIAVNGFADEETTLADYAVGTTFKIWEDGTLYEWVLVSHNYNGVRDQQLLVKKDLLQYWSVCFC